MIGREVDLRKAIDAQARERERADDGQRQDEDGREDRTFDAQRSQPLHDQLTFDSVGELRDVLRRDALAGLQALGDFDEIADRLTGRDDALFDVVAVDDVHAAGAGDGQRRAAAGTSTPGVRAGCSMRAVANRPGLSSPFGVRHDRLDRQRALIGLERRRDVLHSALELAARDTRPPRR